MEENSSSDDEVTCKNETSGKKIKLNDGSSQDSLKETVGSSSKDENVDSGVSADKSESTSSDDRAAGTSAGPSNEVVNIAPSMSNVETILVNIRRPRRGRNYRKRKTPERDPDSNASSRDSDDLSVDESQPSRPVAHVHSNSDTESDLDVHRFMDLGSTESDASNSAGSHSSTSHTLYSYDSDDIIRMPSGDTDSDDAIQATWRQGEPESENKDRKPSVLLKQRPKHSYDILREIIHREMGLTFPSGKTTKADVMFERRFYGSLHAIYRMKKLHNLNKHRGCVNSINFHPEGHLLVSGSDDMNIVVWDWAKNAALQTVKTGHKSNVFQSKFLYLNAQSQLNIVTCARDGQVRLIQCPNSGGAGTRRRLCTHARAAHKLHVSPAEPHLVLSAGEDGLVMQCDVRSDHATRLLQVKDLRCNVPVPLYSVHGHPLEPRELAVAGRDKYIRVYDRRKSLRPLTVYAPSFFKQPPQLSVLNRVYRILNVLQVQSCGAVVYCLNFFEEIAEPASSKRKVRLNLTHLTCAVYNHDGTELLGSYNDEDIYLFDTKVNARDPSEGDSDSAVASTSASDLECVGYTHMYNGHRNSATFKGVAFFGPNSEYIVSGSDCSNIYIWHKDTESIVQWMKGDTSGVVNCIEAHPRHPVLATSGLDRDVKIWMPRAHHDPAFEGLDRVVRENAAAHLRSPLFNDFLPSLYNAWTTRNGEPRLFTEEERGAPGISGENIEFDGNVCTAM